MKIINGKELGHMPNGTVFSDIKDTDFNPNYFAGDVFINGLNIMCGYDKSLNSKNMLSNAKNNHSIIPMHKYKQEDDNNENN